MSEDAITLDPPAAACLHTVFRAAKMLGRGHVNRLRLTESYIAARAARIGMTEERFRELIEARRARAVAELDGKHSGLWRGEYGPRPMRPKRERRSRHMPRTTVPKPQRRGVFANGTWGGS